MKNRGMVGIGDLGTAGMLALIIAVGLLAGLYGAVQLGLYSPGGGAVIPGTGTGAVVVTKSQCGDDGKGTIYFRLKNQDNTATAEWFAAAFYLYKKVGNTYQYVTTANSPTDGTYQNFSSIPCGEQYVIYVLSADGASGDNNYIDAIDNPASGSAVSLANGVVSVDMQAEDAYITAMGSQHATLEFRAKDILEDGMMYDTGDSSATDWETTGVVFTSTTGAGTNMTVANGGNYEVDIQMRAVQTDTRFASDGPGSVLAFINADVATWTSDGTTLNCDGGATNIGKSGLTKEESDKYSNNEFVYKLNGVIKNNPHTVCTISGKAQANPGTWYCPIVTFASRGNYLGTLSGDIVQHSAAKDDSSYTSVNTAQTVTLRTNACTASA